MKAVRGIPSRRSRLLCGLALAAAVSAAGCNMKDWKLGRSKEPEAPPEEARDTKVQQLQAEIDTLGARVEELGKRNDRLTEKLNQAEFINDQLAKQLKVVAGAPRMRDYYKDLAAERQLEIERLTRRIRRLEKLLGIPSTAPATRPATRPAGGGAPPRAATGPASRPAGDQ